MAIKKYAANHSLLRYRVKVAIIKKPYIQNRILSQPGLAFQAELSVCELAERKSFRATGARKSYREKRRKSSKRGLEPTEEVISPRTQLNDALIESYGSLDKKLRPDVDRHFCYL